MASLPGLPRFQRVPQCATALGGSPSFRPATFLAPLSHRARATQCAASSSNGDHQPASNDDWISGLGLAALWLALVGYAFFLSPNQVPVRDQFFIEWFLGLKPEVGGQGLLHGLQCISIPLACGPLTSIARFYICSS